MTFCYSLFLKESAESPEGGPNDNSMASTSTKSVSMADDDNNALQISSVAADVSEILLYCTSIL